MQKYPHKGEPHTAKWLAKSADEATEVWWGFKWIVFNRKEGDAE